MKITTVIIIIMHKIMRVHGIVIQGIIGGYYEAVLSSTVLGIVALPSDTGTTQTSTSTLSVSEFSPVSECSIFLFSLFPAAESGRVLKIYINL
jgi:hypothetical protein